MTFDLSNGTSMVICIPRPGVLFCARFVDTATLIRCEGLARCWRAARKAIAIASACTTKHACIEVGYSADRTVALAPARTVRR